jgi:hypothetical protein
MQEDRKKEKVKRKKYSDVAFDFNLSEMVKKVKFE